MAERGMGIGVGTWERMQGKKHGDMARALGKRHVRKGTETRTQEQWHRGNGTWTRALGKGHWGKGTREWRQGHKDKRSEPRAQGKGDGRKDI